MQLTNAAFPRLDLQQQRMLDLTISCFITDEPSVMSLLKNLDLLKIGEFASYSAYGIGKTKYEVLATVSLAPGGGLIVKTSYYSIEAGVGLPPQQSSPRLATRLLNHLSQLTPEFRLTCIARLLYEADEAAAFQPWFEPPPVLPSPGTPRRLTTMDTVSGSKYAGDDDTDISAYDYGVTFDNTIGSALSVELDFTLTSTLTVKLAATAFDRAVAIAALLRP